MKKLMQKWWLLFITAVFSFSLLGCNVTTGNEELDQAIVDVVVDGVNSYLENAANGENS